MYYYDTNYEMIDQVLATLSISHWARLCDIHPETLRGNIKRLKILMEKNAKA
jgi:hypothetical protein